MHAQFNCKQSNSALCTDHRSRRKQSLPKPRIEVIGEPTPIAAELKRTTTMSTNRKIALIATLATLVAAPAFALDADTASVTVNSGRYIGEQFGVPTGA